MRPGDSRSPSGPGILPMQDHSWKEGKVPVEDRQCLLGWRVVKPRTKYGETVYGRDTVGDVTGWTLWLPTDRPCGSWRPFWPALTVTAASAPPPGDSGSSGGDSSGGGPPRGEIPPDSRTPGGPAGGSSAGRSAAFGAATTGTSVSAATVGRRPEPPNGGATFGGADVSVLPVGGLWKPDGRFAKKRPASRSPLPPRPGGMVSGVVESTDESKQVDLVLHCDSRQVSATRGPDPSYGTQVCDVDGAGDIDPTRSASLQTGWQVIPRPTGTLSLRGNSANALSWTIGVTGLREALGGFVTDGAGSSAQHARVNVRDGGPFDVGPHEDKHLLGTDGDQRNINPLHLSTLAFFHDGTTVRDGPVHFESERYPGVMRGPLRMEAHLKWDGGFPYEWPRDSRDFASTGKWRFHSYCFFGATTPGGGTPDRDTKEPKDPPPPVEGEPPTTPGDPGGPTTPGGGGRHDQPISPTQDLNGSSTATPWAYGYTTTTLALGGIAARPQPISAGMLDLFHDLNPDPAAVDRHNRTAPVVGHDLPWGAHRGGEWTYGQRPGHSRWQGGTAAGGWLHLPPEVDGIDAAADLAPAGVTTSTRTDVYAPGVKLGFGVPDLATGAMKSGWTVTEGGSDLAVASVASGTSTTRVTFRTTGAVLADGYDLDVGETVGTRIGTSPKQKLGFFGALAVDQPAAIADASGGPTIDTEARAQLNALLAALRDLGLIAT